MRLGADAERIHAAGAEVIAISTDDEARQAAMFARWPTPHVRYVADPGGARYLRPLGLFDPDERGGIGLPAMIVLDPDGREAYRYVGRDFADRTTDDDVLAAVESLGLDPIDAPGDDPAGSPVAGRVAGRVAGDADDPPGAFLPEWFAPYFLGNRFGAIAIGGRLQRGDPGRGVAREHRLMCDAALTAWDQLTKRARHVS